MTFYTEVRLMLFCLFMTILFAIFFTIFENDEKKNIMAEIAGGLMVVSFLFFFYFVVLLLNLKP